MLIYMYHAEVIFQVVARSWLDFYLQHCILYSTVYYIALYIIQHCLYYSKDCILLTKQCISITKFLQFANDCFYEFENKLNNIGFVMFMEKLMVQSYFSGSAWLFVVYLNQVHYVYIIILDDSCFVGRYKHYMSQCSHSVAANNSFLQSTGDASWLLVHIIRCNSTDAVS